MRQWCDNPSGSRPNFFGRQNLTFGKGGKGVGDSLHFVKPAKRSFKGKGIGAKQGIVRFWEGRCGWGTIPTVLTAERLSNYKSRIYHIKTL